MNDASIMLVNGIINDCLPSNDRGLHYGDGVFETIAVHQGVPLLWEAHLARLQNGLKRLGISPPPTTLLVHDAEQLCRHIDRGVLKLIVTRGVGGRGYRPSTGEPTRIASLSPWPVYPRAWVEEGVDVRVCATRLATQPRLAGIKHLNRLEQVLARAEWGDDAAEGLMADESGNIIEGTMTNLFLVRDGELFTPAIEHCGVAGVMRAEILARATRIGLVCQEGTLTQKTLGQAQEVFLTNSLIGVWPVRRIEERRYDHGNITRKIRAALDDAICPT